MHNLLPSEILSLKYDAPHQRMNPDEEEQERYAYDRFTAYFERERDDYIRDNNFLRTL